jgi:hypothetical protein
MNIRPGSIIYGNDKYGNDIYKDSKGYYVEDWSPEKGDFKLYIKAKGIPKKPIAKLQCTRKGKGCLWKLTNAKTRKRRM